MISRPVANSTHLTEGERRVRLHTRWRLEFVNSRAEQVLRWSHVSNLPGPILRHGRLKIRQLLMRWRVPILPVELHRLLTQHGTGRPLRFQCRNTLLHICERVQDAILKNDREHHITTAEINVLSDRSHQFLLTSRALLGSDRVPLLCLVVDRDDCLIFIGRK